MSLKSFLFLVPIAAGGWYVAQADEAPADGLEAAQATAAPKAKAPRKSAEECARLEQRLLEGNAERMLASGEPDRARPNGLATVMRVRGMYNELVRQGCNPGAGNGPGGGRGFTPVRSEMGEAPRFPPASQSADVSFERGQPMVDVGGED